MKKDTKPKKKSRIRLLHQYYSYTGFYRFVWRSVKKALIPIILLIAALFAIDRFVLDIDAILTTITQTFSAAGILGVFLASESILGLIPPEIFIAWSEKSANPILYLSLLALASYIGGIISYFIGRGMTKIPVVHEKIEVKMAQQIKNTRKWGGFLIIVGALLPIPFAVTSIAAGIIDFSFRSYLLFGLLRFLRFYLYAAVIFGIL
ncbi:MAG: VTT domain-containing protein [Salegentibacter sp.]